MPEQKNPSESDVQHVLDHVRNALTLISRHDDGHKGLGSFKTYITLVTPTKYRVRVIDAHPGRSGRPEHGEPRFYDVDVSIAPAVKGGH